MADLTKLTAELAGMKQKMVDRLVAQGDETIQPDDTMQTIVDHFDNLRTKIVNQDKEITANGEYTADEGYTGLGKVTVDVKFEPVPKYGITIDAFLGDVNANGVLQATTVQEYLVFDGVKEIAASGLTHRFFYNIAIKTVSFPDLETVNQKSLSYAFQNTNIQTVYCPLLKTIKEGGMRASFIYCEKLTAAYFGNLETINAEACYYMFQNAKKLTHADFSNLKTAVGSLAMSYMFYNCSGLETIDLGKLEIIDGNNIFSSILAGCTKLKSINLNNLSVINGTNPVYQAFSNTAIETISFPSLTTVNALSSMFSNCKALTEIHFRADMQATIEALTGYSSKFGAPSTCTIYFDL